MSVVALGKLTRDVCRDHLARQSLQRTPLELLDRYALTADERAAVLDLDAERLLDLGLNPIVMRNLLVSAGVPHDEIHRHQRSLRERPAGA